MSPFRKRGSAPSQPQSWESRPLQQKFSDDDISVSSSPMSPLQAAMERIPETHGEITPPNTEFNDIYLPGPQTPPLTEFHGAHPSGVGMNPSTSSILSGTSGPQLSRQVTASSTTSSLYASVQHQYPLAGSQATYASHSSHSSPQLPIAGAGSPSARSMGPKRPVGSSPLDSSISAPSSRPPSPQSSSSIASASSSSQLQNRSNSVPPSALPPPLTRSRPSRSSSTLSDNDNTSQGPQGPWSMEFWNSFYSFSSGSRPSDPLTYAVTRKEAFLLYNRANTPSSQMDIIELWTIMGVRFLLKSRLLFSPAAMAIAGGSVFDSPRYNILDLHTVLKAPWGWQVALDFPQARIYGYNYQIPGMPMAPPQDPNVGPPNYIPVAGGTLFELPFEDNTFEVVSSKSLWYALRQSDWGRALAEIYRVLKPGGSIELLTCDLDLINSSDRDKFWLSKLQAHAANELDAHISRTLHAKLRNAGFEDINRALLALPRGWGGRIGHLTEFLGLYYADAMYSYFGNLTPDELSQCRADLLVSSKSGSHVSGNLQLFYAMKPNDDPQPA